MINPAALLQSCFPKISIITPSFKSQRFIEVTIKSVLDQEYPNLEYIILDGAGDETYKILEKYDARLTYWRSRPDGGQYNAINEGFSLATGDIFYWINADDILLPRSLFIVAEIFTSFPNVEWLSTLKPGTWDANSYLVGCGSIPGFNKKAFLDGFYLPGAAKQRAHWIQQESTFFRKSLWVRSGAKIPNYSLAGDFALWCEFFQTAELYGVDYPLAGFRHVQGQRSEAMDEYLRQANQALNILRQKEQWKVSRSKKLVDNNVIKKIPKLRGLIKNNFGYEGQSIVNGDLKKIGTNWRVNRYKFVP